MEFDQRTYTVIGAAMLVHGELGPGYLEVTYQSALAIELEHRNVPFQREVPIHVWFRGRKLGGAYRADFQVHQDILVEIKALPMVGRREAAQLAHYLTATGMPLGLLLNFGAESLEFQRVLPRRSRFAGPVSPESAELLREAANKGIREETDTSSSAQSQAPRS